MIADDHRFMGIKIDHQHFQIVATLAQLRAFIRQVSSGEVSMDRKLRFCFDLDGTLVTEPRVSGDLSTCEPVARAIRLVRELHDAGHTIVIVTSRGMDLGRGLDAALAEAGSITFKTLAQFAIPYDELHFGKPCADIYVDSRTLNAQPDIIERDLGWHAGPTSPADEALDGAIDARAFNLVRAKGHAHVLKSSTWEILRGECHWYRSIHPGVASLFPKPLEIVDGDGSKPHASITMEKVVGVSFSHLATSRLLLRGSLRKMVQAIHRVHTQVPVDGSPVAGEQRATTQELCSNYATKVRKRVAKYRELYRELGNEAGLDTDRMAKVVVGFLQEFEESGRAKHAFYIHGDPVFSNILRTPDDEVVFIDMRGELGSRLTTQGDVHYDLSKVYQSLCGYDFMLLDQLLDETSSEIFDGLRAAFWEDVRRLYPDVSHRDVRLHTAAHFFAIVPLHEVRSRMVRYLRTSYSMLSVEGLM
uniref:Aminoglycoside phosphotransferase domain-containing protein n=1 Tax=Zooxanthella nutricula TaxID=1333877 RepID=A0A7S2NU04_9DINO